MDIGSRQEMRKTKSRALLLIPAEAGLEAFVPRGDGVSLSSPETDALWPGFFAGAPWLRTRSNGAKAIAGFSPALRDQRPETELDNCSRFIARVILINHNIRNVDTLGASP